ncbi:MAG: hypothetical protein RIQ78_1726 [Bacteroidota bacterium]|jgi:hypothetical protein
MIKKNQPRQLSFPIMGNGEMGYLAIAEFGAAAPFEIKRVFWTYSTPEEVQRGRHAHFTTEMVIIAVHGSILLTTEQIDGTTHQFCLDNPAIGVFIPTLTWHTMTYSHDAVQLVLSSTPFHPEDYIRDYQLFKSL